MLNILDIETNESVIFFSLSSFEYKYIMNFKNSVKLITDWNILLPVLSSVVKIKFQLT